MKIEKGYNSKPTHIKINPREEGGAELWIKQEGTVEWLLGATTKKAVEDYKYRDFEVVQDQYGNRLVFGEVITEYTGRETLSYMTIEELIALRDECNAVIRELAGL